MVSWAGCAQSNEGHCFLIDFLLLFLLEQRIHCSGIDGIVQGKVVCCLLVSFYFLMKVMICYNIMIISPKDRLLLM